MVFPLDSAFNGKGISMIYLERNESGERILYAIEDPGYLIRQRNGVIVLCPNGHRAQGILSPDGETMWQLEGRDPLGEDLTVVRFVTMAEYDQWEAMAKAPMEPDPEDTEPEIPENVEPETVLTRAELSEKVRRLEEELAAAKAALGLETP